MDMLCYLSLPIHLINLKLTSTGCCASDVTEQIDVGIPEDAIEAQNDLVEIAESEALDGGLLPLRQGRVKAHRVLLSRSLFDGYFEHSECQC